MCLSSDQSLCGSQFIQCFQHLALVWCIVSLHPLPPPRPFPPDSYLPGGPAFRSGKLRASVSSDSQVTQGPSQPLQYFHWGRSIRVHPSVSSWSGKGVRKTGVPYRASGLLLVTCCSRLPTLSCCRLALHWGHMEKDAQGRGMPISRPVTDSPPPCGPHHGHAECPPVPEKVGGRSGLRRLLSEGLSPTSLWPLCLSEVAGAPATRRLARHHVQPRVTESLGDRPKSHCGRQPIRVGSEISDVLFGFSVMPTAPWC